MPKVLTLNALLVSQLRWPLAANACPLLRLQLAPNVGRQKVDASWFACKVMLLFSDHSPQGLWRVTGDKVCVVKGPRFMVRNGCEHHV